MTLERGTVLNDRYRIVEILGQGGMGAVYRAIDENLGIEVAVKENLFTSEEYSRQFRLEAVILANLRHPNLPRVYDHFEIADQGQYMIMDFIEGEDLRERMERLGAIPDEDAIRIGAAICDALTFLHSRTPPVLHRDIKPGNIKITPDGQIYLVDFGLAKVAHGNQVTTTGARAMTPGYSPPEQYGTARTDARTDIYSLGATLYAALTGQIPEDALARAMDNATLTPVRKHNPKVGRRLAAAIEKAMSIDPDDRFQSAAEFKQALLKASSKTGQLTGPIRVSPPPDTPPPPPDEPPADPPSDAVPSSPSNPLPDLRSINPPPPRKKKARKGKGSGCGAVLFVLFLFALVTALVLSFVFPQTAQDLLNRGYGLLHQEATATVYVPLPPIVSGVTHTPTPTFTATPTATASPTPTFTPSITPTPSDTPTPTNTPIGGGWGQIAFASDRTGIPQIWLVNSDGSNLQQLTNLPDGACQPDWSPDGSQLVFVSPCKERQDKYENSGLYIMNADGSGLTPLPTVPGGDYDPAWSPDGRYIAFTSLRDGYPQIYVYDLVTEETRRLTETRSDVWARYPAWSPQGTQIVYTVRRVSVYQIWYMTSNGDLPTQLTRSNPNLWDFQPVWSPDGKVILFSQSKAQPGAISWVASLRYDDRENAVSTRLDAIQPLPVQDLDISPDGFWLIFESNVDNNFDIYMSTLTGGHQTRLTDNPAYDFDPAWRPYQP